MPGFVQYCHLVVQLDNTFLILTQMPKLHRVLYSSPFEHRDYLPNISVSLWLNDLCQVYVGKHPENKGHLVF